MRANGPFPYGREIHSIPEHRRPVGFFSRHMSISWVAGETRIYAMREVMPLGELFGYNNLT